MKVITTKELKLVKCYTNLSLIINGTQKVINKHIKNVNFFYCQFRSCTFIDCIFEACSFEDTDIIDSIFIDCKFDITHIADCNISKSHIDNTQFHHCSLIDTNISKTHISTNSFFKHTQIRYLNLSQSNIINESNLFRDSYLYDIIGDNKNILTYQLDTINITILLKQKIVIIDSFQFSANTWLKIYKSKQRFKQLYLSTQDFIIFNKYLKLIKCIFITHNLLSKEDLI